jgi:hypothetical protein
VLHLDNQKWENRASSTYILGWYNQVSLGVWLGVLHHAA